MTATVVGSFFIIPNSAFRLSNHPAESTREGVRVSLRNIGVEVSEDEDLIEVWYISTQCDNWGSHRWKENPEFFGAHGIPSRLPKSLIEGLREGDVLALQWSGAGEPRELQLRAAQLEYRYRQFGTFEEVLKRVCRQ